MLLSKRGNGVLFGLGCTPEPSPMVAHGPSHDHMPVGQFWIGAEMNHSWMTKRHAHVSADSHSTLAPHSNHTKKIR
jgi:nicotinamide mononucleotide (NMN) deamidase PncC